MSTTTSVLRRQAYTNRNFSRAFTVVELLLVIVIIGILLAVTVASYGAWQVRVAETEVSSNLHGVLAGMEDARNRTDAYPVYASGTQFNGVNSTRGIFRQSENVTVTYSSGTATTFCITAQSNKESSVSMHIDTSSSLEPLDGSC